MRMPSMWCWRISNHQVMFCWLKDTVDWIYLQVTLSDVMHMCCAGRLMGLLPNDREVEAGLAKR